MAACAWHAGLSLGHLDARFLTKTFRSESKLRRFVLNEIELTRSEDVSSRVAGISLIANWSPMDSYLLPGTIYIIGRVE